MEQIVASWGNGTYVSIDKKHSLIACGTFVGDLAELIEKFGPAKIEIKKDGNKTPGGVHKEIRGE